MHNRYSPTWFRLFMSRESPDYAAVERGFLTRQLPLPAFRRVLDLCCGYGRHVRLLAEGGYAVVGVDRDLRALAEARRRTAGLPVEFVAADMREVAAVPGEFDAVICLWQSFGYFQPSENAEVLRQLAAKLRPGGRCILDLYHRAYYERQQGSRRYEIDGSAVAVEQWMLGDRLQVHLEYAGGGDADRFDWQLFAPDDLAAMASGCGLDSLLACAEWDEGRAVSAESARMQIVLERRCV